MDDLSQFFDFKPTTRLKRRFSRETLADDLSDEASSGIVTETLRFLERRAAQVIEFNDVGGTNLNPFLLRAQAPLYGLRTVVDVARHLQMAKALHGDDTAFGRMAEEKYLTLFGATTPPEKSADPVLWSPIDLDITVDGHRYLISVKSGPWTMNQSHAHEMVSAFPEIRARTGARIMVGVVYGDYSDLNNKPQLVADRLGQPDWFDFMAGTDFWEFVTGVRDADERIYACIDRARMTFEDAQEGQSFHERVLGSQLGLAASLRSTYGKVLGRF